MSLPPTCEEELEVVKALLSRTQNRYIALKFACEQFIDSVPYDWPREIEIVLDAIKEGKL